jgi:hypothetical protein
MISVLWIEELNIANQLAVTVPWFNRVPEYITFGKSGNVANHGGVLDASCRCHRQTKMPADDNYPGEQIRFA